MASADPTEHAWRRRNFFWAALNGALFEFGASFADTGTVVATFLGRLTPAPMAVGAAAAIARFGWLVPQLFAAHYAQGLRYRKGIYLVGGWGRAVSLGALAAVLLWPSSLHHAPGVVLAVFFALWTLFSFVAGLAGAAYNDVIARTITSGSRSRLLATRLFVGATLAAGGGLLIRAILGASPEPSLVPYGLIFGAGAIVLALSTLCFAAIREPPAPVVGQRRACPPSCMGEWKCSDVIGGFVSSSMPSGSAASRGWSCLSTSSRRGRWAGFPSLKSAPCSPRRPWEGSR